MAYLEFSLNDFNLRSLLFEYRFPEDHQAPKWYAEKINSLYSMLYKALEVQFPKMSETDRKEAMLVIWSAIHGICALHLKGKLDKVGAKSASALIDNFLKKYLANLS